MASQTGGVVIGNFFTTNSILVSTDSTFGGIMQLEMKSICFHTGIWLLSHRLHSGNVDRD
jgi:hypothetical protein